jgi:hypothetical protein
MAKSHKGSKRGPKKGSKRGSKRSPKKGSKRSPKKGSKKSKKCPPGTRKSYKKLASGKLSKKALCLPFGRKAAPMRLEREEGEPGNYAEDEFNLPALGFRVKRRGSRRGTRKTHRRRHSRKY